MSIEMQYSPTADALYVQFSNGPAAYSVDISRVGHYQRGVDYADDGTLVGVEFLEVSRGIDLTDVPRADEIARHLADLSIRRVA